MPIDARLRDSLEDAWISICLDHHKSLWPENVKLLPPRLWEAARLRLQGKMRQATGEPTLIVSFEVPRHD